MEIRLEGSRWITFDGNEYVIDGDKDYGYEVLERHWDEKEEDYRSKTVFESKDFEECLTWCYNS